MNENSMIVDCGGCVVRGIGCSDCAVGVLLNAPPTPEFDHAELRAIDALAEGGLIPRLRLVPARQERTGRAA